MFSCFLPGSRPVNGEVLGTSGEKAMKNLVVLVLAGTGLLAGSAHAGLVIEVVVTGEVVFNAIGVPPLGDVNPGETAVMSFLVDSNVFIDSIPGDVRAYEIDHSSFSLEFSGGVIQGLLIPFPGTPYFGVIDGFPVSDGFFVSSSIVSPGGVALQQEIFQANLSLGYVGSTLSSVDILDAVGTYDFTGLTSFGFNLWSGFPDNVALDIDFQQMTISVIPAPATLAVLAPMALGLRRRRRG